MDDFSKSYASQKRWFQKRCIKKKLCTSKWMIFQKVMQVKMEKLCTSKLMIFRKVVHLKSDDFSKSCAPQIRSFFGVDTAEKNRALTSTLSYRSTNVGCVTCVLVGGARERSLSKLAGASLPELLAGASLPELARRMPMHWFMHASCINACIHACIMSVWQADRQADNVFLVHNFSQKR